MSDQEMTTSQKIAAASRALNEAMRSYAVTWQEAMRNVAAAQEKIRPRIEAERARQREALRKSP